MPNKLRFGKILFAKMHKCGVRRFARRSQFCNTFAEKRRQSTGKGGKCETKNAKPTQKEKEGTKNKLAPRHKRHFSEKRAGKTGEGVFPRAGSKSSVCRLILRSFSCIRRARPRQTPKRRLPRRYCPKALPPRTCPQRALRRRGVSGARRTSGRSPRAR